MVDADVLADWRGVAVVRDTVLDCLDKLWREDEVSLWRWAYRCAHAEAVALRSVVELRFDVWDREGPLGYH